MIALLAFSALLFDESVIGPSPWYARLVDQYRGGDREAAVAEEAPPEKFRYEINAVARLVEAVRRCPSCPIRRELDSFSLPAAVMLHTDRAFAMFEVYDSAAQAELDLPPRLIALMDDAPRREFEPRWVLATALELSHQAQWDLALGLLDKALLRYPGDARMLLARGAALESKSRLDADAMIDDQRLTPFGGLRRDSTRSEPRQVRDTLRRAEESYRQALAAQPDLVHARVRLGRVLELQGRSEAAMPELQAVLAGASEPRDRYLAHLFLGWAHEHAGLPDRAAAEYAEALRAVPDGQAAAVALSHALHRQGRWPASVDALHPGVDRAGRRQVVDPWWPYLAGQSEDPEVLLEQLRAEVSR